MGISSALACGPGCHAFAARPDWCGAGATGEPRTHATPGARVRSFGDEIETWSRLEEAPYAISL
jgi:hypothetical protein